MRSAALLLALAALSCGERGLAVHSVEPGLGVIRGGETITVSGSGLEAAMPVSVSFGGRRAASVSSRGADRLAVVTPEMPREGVVDVRVTAADGTELVVRDGFEFVRKNEMAECVNVSRALNGEPPGDR